MMKMSAIACLCVLLLPVFAVGEVFHPAAYTAITQEELVKDPGAHAGKKYRVTVYGTFDYMGSNYRYMIVDRLVVEKEK